MVSFGILLGDRLGLFKTMGEQLKGKSVTTDEFAKLTGYDRRWLMEWLRGMTAAKVLEYETGTDTTERFRMTPEMSILLGREMDQMNPMFVGGLFQGGFPKELVDGTLEAF